GKQGYAMARVLAQRGADVTLIAGNTAGLVDPAGVDVVHIGSAAQLRDAVSKHAPEAHVLVMAAAVADFRPVHVETNKIKKGATEPTVIELTRTDDVLAGAVRARSDGQLPNMRAIVGSVGENRAFEVDSNQGWLLASDGTEVALEHGSKTLMASRIVDAIVAFLHNSGG